VHQVLQGYNCTVFAYGQTGTGKTHTMEGPPDDAFPNGKVPVIILWQVTSIKNGLITVLLFNNLLRLLKNSGNNCLQDHHFDLLLEKLQPKSSGL